MLALTTREACLFLPYEIVRVSRGLLTGSALKAGCLCRIALCDSAIWLKRHTAR